MLLLGAIHPRPPRGKKPSPNASARCLQQDMKRADKTADRPRPRTPSWSQRLSSPEQWFQCGASENVARERPTLVRPEHKYMYSVRAGYSPQKQSCVTVLLYCTVLPGSRSITGLWSRHKLYTVYAKLAVAAADCAMTWRMDIVKNRYNTTDRHKY